MCFEGFVGGAFPFDPEVGALDALCLDFGQDLGNSSLALSPNHVLRPENSELLILRVSASDLWHHFEKLTARHDRGSLIFDRSIDVNNGPGAMFKRLLEYLTNGIQSGGMDSSISP